MVSASMSTGVSPSSETVATTIGGCTQVVGSGIDDMTGIAAGVVVVLGIRVATAGESSLFVPGSGDSDGSITDMGPIIELDCCCCDELASPLLVPPLLPLLLLSVVAMVELTTRVDSRLRNSSALAKSSSSLV